MEDILELKEERSYKLRAAKDLVERAEKEGRLPTDEEVKLIESYRQQAADIKKKIDQLEEHQRRKEALDAELESMKRPEKRRVPETETQDQRRKPVIEFPYRVRALRAFRSGATARENEERAYRCGQWALAMLWGSPAAKRWCRDNDVQIRAQTEGSNTAGGYLVPDEMANTIIDLREEYGVFRKYADVKPMGRDVMPIPKSTGHLTAYVVGEGESGTESSKAYANINLTARKLMVLCAYSSELDEDAVINIADDLARDAAWALAKLEDTIGFVGDGSAAHMGVKGVCTLIEDAGSSYKSYVQAATGHDTWAEIDVSDITTLMGALPQYADPNAAFFGSKVAINGVFSHLKATAGGNSIQTLSGRVTPDYLGYPLVVSQVMPNSTSSMAGHVMLLHGDLKLAATIGDRRGITMKRSEEKGFSEDMVWIKVTTRTDIVVHGIGDTSEAGPIVALVGTAAQG
jgi:HK97 family phage major capsid protein